MSQRKIGISLQFIAYCTIIGVPYAVALIGNNVRPAIEHELPFVVSISMRPHVEPASRNSHFCGGIVISEWTILTAEGCLRNKHINEVEIIAGNANLQYGQVYYPRSWITYVEWKHENQSHNAFHNIAIITLERELEIDEKIKRIPLTFVESKHLADKTVRIAGWGRDARREKSDILRRATLDIMSNAECTRRGRELKGNTFAVPKNYFCSTAYPPVASTKGDAGGPIWIGNKPNNFAVGINIGGSPSLLGPYTSDLLSESVVNVHLSLYHYRDFIMHFQ